jgi:hypothetical protein
MIFQKLIIFLHVKLKRNKESTKINNIFTCKIEGNNDISKINNIFTCKIEKK